MAVAGDDVADPLIISSVPYRYELDMNGTTSQPTDPNDCAAGVGRSPSVWFTFTPADSGMMVATTDGSDFDTLLYLTLPGEDGQVELIDCNDDAVNGLHSAIRFDAYAGTTYLFMVAPFGGASAGLLVFGLEGFVGEELPEVTIDIDRRVIVDAAGRATVTGTVACSDRMGFLYLEVSLRQRVDRTIIEGWAEVEIDTCTPEGVPWSAMVRSEMFAFGEEPATAHVMTFYCGEWDCWPFEVERDVRMRVR
jgi:hypothetical protein